MSCYYNNAPELQVLLLVRLSAFEHFLAPSSNHGRMAFESFSQHENLLKSKINIRIKNHKIDSSASFGKATDDS